MEFVTTQKFLEVCRRKGVVLDTNLLVLLIVGRTGLSEIKRNERTKKFSSEDYYIVSRLIEISKGRTVYSAPQAIPETMYLLGQDPRKTKGKVMIPQRY